MAARRAPRLALALLRLALDADAFEAIGGDLEEEFSHMTRARGRLRAHAWLWRQTLRAVAGRRLRVDPRAHSRALVVGRRPRLFLEQRWGDVRFAARQLMRAPGFTAVAVIALALGIGLTTTTFSIVRGSLLRGLPFERADELVHFERHNHDEGVFTLAVTPHDYAAWREAQTSVVDLGAYTDVLVIVGGMEVATESHLAILINQASFELLGVQPALGRPFHPDDELPGAAPVILVGDGYWRTRLGADGDVVGKSIRVDGVPTTIVGVMPPSFGFPVEEQLWMPLRLDFTRIARGVGRLDVFGRLLPDKTIADARGEFEIISSNLQQAYPDTNAGLSAGLQTFQQEYIGEDFTTMMLTMLAGAFLVLGIACANVANLLTARATRRTREMAVRSAIGAGGGRLFAQLITEAMALSVLGGVAGLGVAYAGVAVFRAAWARGVPVGLPHGLSNGLFWWQFEIDTGVLAFVVGLTLMTSLVAGVAPAARAARRSPWAAMQTARGAANPRVGRSGRALVVAQFALTAGLAVTAGLMVKSVYKTSTVDSGLPVEQVLTARVQLPAATGDLPDNYPDIGSRLRFWNELETRLGVGSRATAVALATSLPMTRSGSTAVRIQGAHDDNLAQPSAVVVSPGFFDTFDVAPVEGRLFVTADRADAEPVVIVNESFASQALDGGRVVGQRIRLGDAEAAATEPWLTIVGVVPDLWVDGDRHEPTAQYQVYGAFYVVFGGVAMAMATIGLYSVVSYSVNNRAAEIGIRMAIGGRAGEIIGLVLLQGARQIGLGVLTGSAIAVWLPYQVTRILFEVESWDPGVLVGVLALLVATGLAACFAPARRAARVDPLEAMRNG